MKKFILIMAALIITVSAAGCKNNENTSDNTQSSSTDSVQQQLDNYGKDASDNVDMDKIEGTELKEAENEDGLKSGDKIGNYEVSIEDAKIIDYQDSKVVLVSFEFKNNSSQDVNFAGAMSVEADQGESELPPVVVTNVEGFDSTTLAQTVSNGEKIKVQKSYKLLDETTPVTIRVEAFDKANNEGNIEKTFNIE